MKKLGAVAMHVVESYLHKLEAKYYPQAFLTELDPNAGEQLVRLTQMKEVFYILVAVYIVGSSWNAPQTYSWKIIR